MGAGRVHVPTARAETVAPRALGEAMAVGALPLAAALGPIAGVGPVFAFRVLVVVVIGVAVVSRAVTPAIERALVGFAVLVVGVAAASAALSPYPKRWVDVAIVLFGLGLAWALVRIGPRNLVAWCRGWIPAIAVCGVIACWELATKRHLAGYRGGAWRRDPVTYADPGATFVNPNLFAVFLLAALGFGALGVAIERRRAWRIAHLASALAAGLLVVTTHSALALIAIVVGAITALACYRRTRWVAVGLVVLGAIAVTVYLVGPGRSFAEFLHYNFTMVLGNHRLGGYNTVSMRLALLVGATYAAIAYPLTGLGPGAFGAYVSDKPPVTTRGLLNPHNVIGEVISQYGLVVGALALAFFVWMLVMGIRRLRDPGANRPATVALIVAVVAFPIYGACNSAFIGPNATMLVGAAIPMLAATMGCVHPSGRVPPGRLDGHEDHLPPSAPAEPAVAQRVGNPSHEDGPSLP